MPRNRPWSREELILALDLYFKLGASYKTHPDVIGSSGVLNRLSDATGESDDYLAVPEDEIPGLHSVLTVVGGQVVHSSGDL